MPMIISFAWTSASLLAGHKTVTRRGWTPEYGKRFHAGDEILAYDRSPRVHGTPIARLRLTADARYEHDADAPDSDYEAEGFAWYAAHPDRLPKGNRLAYLETVSWNGFAWWRASGGSSWVVRFEVVEILVPMATDPQLALGV